VATKTPSSPIFYGGIYLEVFRERKMDWPTSISMVFSRQGHPSISQGEVIQKLLYHHLMYFTRIGDFTSWRVTDL